MREGERKKDSGESFGVWAEVERDFSGIPLLLERVCFLCVGEGALQGDFWSWGRKQVREGRAETEERKGTFSGTFARPHFDCH